MPKRSVCLVLATLLSAAALASAQVTVSLQGAAVLPGYNDVRIPADSDASTLFSLTGDLKAGIVFSPRIEAGWEISDRHHVGLMASLLRMTSTGKLEKDISFDNRTFTAGTDIKAHYRFDSYRLTYRYMFMNRGAVRLGAGLTGKIRDAEISVENGINKGTSSNTGVVPLINFYAEWMISPHFSLVGYGDALWSPYGRAEDVFAGCRYNLDEKSGILAGYRILEGGSDGSTVHTFAMFHYLVIGLEYTL
jgi:hypothetical protein